MTPQQRLASSRTSSIGDERISITIQAEFDHHTVEQAIASGLLDMPEEPGMVRVPVTIFVTMPGEMLQQAWPPPRSG